MFIFQRSSKTAISYYLRSAAFTKNRRRCSAYGIETKEGIYEIKRRPDITEQTPSMLLPGTILDRKYIEVYCCSDGDAVEQLFTLHKLFRNNSQTKKGFMYDLSYRPCLVHLSDERVATDCKLASGLSKIVFEQTQRGSLRLIEGDEVNTGNEFTVEKMTSTHPIFKSNSNFMPVYKTFEQAKENLSKLCIMHESKAVKELLHSMLEAPSTLSKSTPPKHPFIVVEGLDGTGKSTMTNNLGGYLQAEILGTPPLSIKHIRKEFDALPELCRRSFYAYGNYLAAEQIRRVLDDRPVVLDRYWHSTTAYAMAKDAVEGVEHLPPRDSPLYEWPLDLLKPSALVFLTAKEEDRDERLNVREERTDEENELRDSRMFRKRILEVYQRIGLQGAWVEVDTGGTQQESLEKAIIGLKHIGVL